MGSMDKPVNTDRMTLIEYRKFMGLESIVGSNKSKTNTDTSKASKSVTESSKVPSKYKSKMTIIDGVKFHSLQEANYYSDLKLRLAAKDIKGFCRQPEFILQDGDGTVIIYKADFVVFKLDGTSDVIDCKGFLTDIYRLKKRLFEHQFPMMRIVEVY